MKIKIICGYRKDQEYSVPIEEAHKAYFLFHNRDADAIFSTGVAIQGKDIQRIVPDYQGTMGWNETHTLDDYDMKEIRNKGIDSKIQTRMMFAKNISQVCTPQHLALPLTEVRKLYKESKLLLK